MQEQQKTIEELQLTIDDLKKQLEAMKIFVSTETKNEQTVSK